MPRRPVRVAPGFFEQLDTQFGAERGDLGEPSAADFLTVELPTLIEVFAESFDELPEVIEGVPAARMLITQGALVPALAVFGVLADDGYIDLIGLAVDSP